MKNRIFVTTLIVIVIAVGALISNNRTFSQSSSVVQPKAMPAQQPQQVLPLPEHVPYMFLFHHLVFLRQKGGEIEQQGKGKSVLLTRFQEKAGLTDTQFQILYQVASDCEQEIVKQDQKAMAVIEAMKAHYPDGKLPAGEAPPPLPPELITLQQEHDAIILRARDRLHQAFGEQAFGQFHAFVQSRIASGIKFDISQ
jgi:hypothetical protein